MEAKDIQQGIGRDPYGLMSGYLNDCHVPEHMSKIDIISLIEQAIAESPEAPEFIHGDDLDLARGKFSMMNSGILLPRPTDDQVNQVLMTYTKEQLCSALQQIRNGVTWV